MADRRGVLALAANGHRHIDATFADVRASTGWRMRPISLFHTTRRSTRLSCSELNRPEAQKTSQKVREPERNPKPAIGFCVKFSEPPGL
jgi:hypothetical protein